MMPVFHEALANGTLTAEEYLDAVRLEESVSTTQQAWIRIQIRIC